MQTVNLHNFVHRMRPLRWRRRSMISLHWPLLPDVGSRDGTPHVANEKANETFERKKCSIHKSQIRHSLRTLFLDTNRPRWSSCRATTAWIEGWSGHLLLQATSKSAEENGKHSSGTFRNFPLGDLAKDEDDLRPWEQVALNARSALEGENPSVRLSFPPALVPFPSRHEIPKSECTFFSSLHSFCSETDFI